MKKFFLFIVGIFSITLFGYSQKMIPVQIIMTDESMLEATHFGHLTCNGRKDEKSFIYTKGKYNNVFTEITDYDEFLKLEFEDFSEEPNKTGSEKGIIVAVKANGTRVKLNSAELKVSCFGNDSKYNQIKVQTIDPITENVVEVTVDLKDIKEVIFIKEL